MLSEDKFFQTLNQEEIWKRYCGFTSLSIDDFMEIQNYLLLQQIELVTDSTLGKKIMEVNQPKSVEEFRKVVPLTTYDDYEPYLSEKREDALAFKPLFWAHTSGRGGGGFKWIPYSSDFFNAGFRLYLGFLILAAAKTKGEVRIAPGERMLLYAGPRPYVSGMMFYHMSQAFSIDCMPPFEISETMPFEDRMKLGFSLALRHGVDGVLSLASVLVKIGEMFAGESQGIKPSYNMLHPQTLLRIIRGLLRAKVARRPMLPRDLWDVKGILTGGTDTSIYRDAVTYYWGIKPYEVYAGTEAMIAANLWNKRWLSLIPQLSFLEFIPEEESIKSKEDSGYQPATVLANELEVGGVYEVVITQFYGMPLLRYRLGDAIKVMALSDEEAGVYLPQISFHTRVDDIIDLGGLAKLTEKVIWQAIVNSGIKYNEWSACKEYDGNVAYLRFYIELKEPREVEELERLLDKELGVVDQVYRDVYEYLGMNPVKVTLLSPETFTRYYQAKVEEGADLAHLKPAHMRPSEKVIQELLQLSV